MRYHVYMARLTNKRLQTQIDDLENWLQRQGYDLKFNGNAADCVNFQESAVHINSKQKLENQYYTLLHECGHVWAVENQDEWLDDLPMSKNKLLSNLDGRSERSNAYRVSQLAEEIDAWRIGRNLVDILDHKINLKSYNKLYGDCVWSYVKGYTESKNKK